MGQRPGQPCPVQKIETVDGSPRSEALASGQTTFGELSTTLQEDFRKRLIWGDNRCNPLLKDFWGEIDLIYIDPPFDKSSLFHNDFILQTQLT